MVRHGWSGLAALMVIAGCNLAAMASQEQAGGTTHEVGEPGLGRQVDQFRKELGGHGISLGGTYVAEFSGVVAGGVRRRFDFRNLLTIDAGVDLEQAVGWSGGSAFLQYLMVNPEGGIEGGSNDAGDIQAYSNIESRRHLDVIYELWLQQELLDDRLRLKAGKVDANGEFAFVAVAVDFANSSAGFSPTIFALPTYPDPATGVSLFATVVESDQLDLELSYGFFDGAAAADGVEPGRRGPSTFFNNSHSDDYFHIGQAAVSWEGREGSRWWKAGRASLGVWFHDGTFERFDGGREVGTGGLYATAEQRLWSSGDRSVDVFGQLGWADDAVAEIDGHAALGIVCGGCVPSREEDRMGVYATLAVLSDEPAAGFDGDELAIDAYYRFQLPAAAFVQPEVQYIINPGGDPALENALVVGVRFGIEF
ncbi:MAG: carbohydrate porin [Phycisphaera sp.]|nr:MAG: carbohydrate porin [Phycisphaera sp.]